jgi:hypothetical protein
VGQRALRALPQTWVLSQPVSGMALQPALLLWQLQPA